MEPFFVVMRDKPSSTVTKRHSTYEAAVEEASRLAIKENARFYVLLALAYAEPETPPVKVVILKAEG